MEVTQGDTFNQTVEKLQQKGWGFAMPQIDVRMAWENGSLLHSPPQWGHQKNDGQNECTVGHASSARAHTLAVVT